MSLNYLNTTDFEFDASTGSLLVAKDGIVFVMFYSKTCGHCIKYLPQYTNIPSMFKGINFAACCIDGPNRPIIEYSQKSRTPITSVPKFIVYKNKRPWLEYTGEKSNAAICHYLDQMLRAGAQPAAAQSGQPQGGIRIVGQQASSGSQPQQQPQQQRPPVQPQQHRLQPTQQQSGQPQGGNNPAAGGGYTFDPSTNVPVFETSYGIPYNSTAQQYLQYEQAYKK